MSGRFAGRTAVVTGASRGIGLAVARRIVDEGGRVCVTARKPDALAEAVERLGPNAIGIAGAADDAGHREEVIRTVTDRFGPPGVLVNNTGINPAYGGLFEADPGAVRKIFEVNVLAALAWVGAARQVWKPGAAVVNVASVAGLRPAEKLGAYGASKAALIHLTQQLAAELAPDVRVNAVAPAVVRTRFAGAMFDGREDEVVAGYPLGRLGTPEDVAAAVAFLASDDAAWITGQVLTLDGGRTLNGGV
ncbi:SDR family oxidoreductase [Actinoplanes bogorensis]|uniref:SDR family oxidoreductase n=1 Tax=Paractinoplanes bogorensis TaxID=1610840 RepID=A0ABS5YUR9_9ACTN|nr:SDR family oxidoreductase [Actinoplanes bogorensis]MBU2667202.1 SDR family oxidoreductase [Actinoplanes bogorensis]